MNCIKCGGELDEGYCYNLLCEMYYPPIGQKNPINQASPIQDIDSFIEQEAEKFAPITTDSIFNWQRQDSFIAGATALKDKYLTPLQEENERLKEDNDIMGKLLMSKDGEFDALKNDFENLKQQLAEKDKDIEALKKTKEQ